MEIKPNSRIRVFRPYFIGSKVTYLTFINELSNSHKLTIDTVGDFDSAHMIVLADEFIVTKVLNGGDLDLNNYSRDAANNTIGAIRLLDKALKTEKPLVLIGSYAVIYLGLRGCELKSNQGCIRTPRSRNGKVNYERMSAIGLMPACMTHEAVNNVNGLIDVIFSSDGENKIGVSLSIHNNVICMPELLQFPPSDLKMLMKYFQNHSLDEITKKFITKEQKDDTIYNVMPGGGVFFDENAGRGAYEFHLRP